MLGRNDNFEYNLHETFYLKKLVITLLVVKNVQNKFVLAVNCFYVQNL